MDLEELKATLKKQHGLDIDDIVAKASKFDEANSKAEKVGALREALKGAGVELSEDDEDIVTAVKELMGERADLHSRVVALSETVSAMETASKHDKAVRLVTPYAAEGFVAESEREKMIKLAETDYDLAEGILKGLTKGVLLSEKGGSHSDPDPSKPKDPVELSEEDAMAEIERIRKEHGLTAGS